MDEQKTIELYIKHSEKVIRENKDRLKELKKEKPKQLYTINIIGKQIQELESRIRIARCKRN